MVEKRVKYILVLLEQVCDDILLELRFRRRRTSRRGWCCSGRRRMCRCRRVCRLRRRRLRGNPILSKLRLQLIYEKGKPGRILMRTSKSI
jgi:hypothetical protein